MPYSHPVGEFSITSLYSVPDDAWYLELDLVGGQRNLVTATVPDEDPAREPMVCFNPVAPHLDIPYEVVPVGDDVVRLRGFMDRVEEEIRTSRAWMRLRPGLVEVIHRLRQEYLGVIDDDEFARVLEEVRGEVPEADLPVVVAEAFGRKPDGTALLD